VVLPSANHPGSKQEVADELAGGEVIEGAEAAGELVGAQAAVAVEPAEKLFVGALGLIGVAFQTARH